MRFEPKSFAYSIVVVGKMNPWIHHPSWYRSVGLLDETEEKRATEIPLGFILPFPIPMPPGQVEGLVTGAHFETEAFRITCHQNRWEIMTSTSGFADRIYALTERLFDDVLPHTPVSAVGFNFNFEFDMGGSGIGSTLGRLVCSIPINIGVEQPTTAEWKVVENRGKAIVSITVRQGSNDSSVAILTNSHYSLISKMFESFTLSERFRGEYDLRRLDAERQAPLIVESLTSIQR